MRKKTLSILLSALALLFVFFAGNNPAFSTERPGASFYIVKAEKKQPTTSKSSNAGHDRSLFDSPLHKAIETMLLDSGDDEILRTASGIASSDLGDFGVAEIRCKKEGKQARIQAFLFKENTQWKAYRKIPAHLDHPGMFFLLARRHCADTWKHFNGIGYMDESWKTRGPKKRAISFKCSELIDNQWTDHPLKITYTYDKKTGWRISNVSDLKEASQKMQAPNKEAVEFADDVVDRFFLSIMAGDSKTVKGFMDAGMSPNVKRPRLGHSPLFAAVLGGHDAMALMFIKAGGDVNFKDENQSTPLMWVADRCQSAPLVKALIDAGADVNARAKGGGTPLLGAEVNRCAEIVKMLKAAGAK